MVTVFNYFVLIVLNDKPNQYATSAMLMSHKELAVVYDVGNIIVSGVSSRTVPSGNNIL